MILSEEAGNFRILTSFDFLSLFNDKDYYRRSSKSTFSSGKPDTVEELAVKYTSSWLSFENEDISSVGPEYCNIFTKDNCAKSWRKSA